jgi:TonB family protein
MSISFSADDSPGAGQQNDRLLWLAAAVVVGIGLTWLVLSKPWSSGSVRPPAPQSAAPAAETAVAEPASAGPAPRTPSAGLNDPLRMAQLAFEAGMLVEPEDYSAWALYAGILADDPESTEARRGLAKIAEILNQRALTALEQGRFDDARATADRILGVLPENRGARELIEELERSAPKPAPIVVAAPALAEPGVEATRHAPTAAVAPPPEIERSPAPATPAAPPKPMDLTPEYHASFEAALAENRLLTPADASAMHFVELLLMTAPAHELTRQAQRTLAAELLARADRAREAFDPDAARTWIEVAEPIAVDLGAIDAARSRLVDTLVAMESAKRLPASELEILHYVAPEYPARAITRSVEGWVDVEFTVGYDGAPREISVADASHDRFFRNEAIGAVSQWRFKPRTFMSRPVESRTYTRIRFAMEQR